MDDRPGHHPAQHHDRPEQSGGGGAPPGGLSFPAAPNESGPPPGAEGAGGGNHAVGPKVQQAVIAMIIGLSSTILALVGCCNAAVRIGSMLAGLAAVVLGILAQQRISKSAGRLVGTPQAAIGIASGAVAIFLGILVALVLS